MKIGALYSHLNGHEWMLVHRKKLWKEIERVIAGVDAPTHMTKVSKEKGMAGELKFSPTSINAGFKSALAGLGWKEQRASYWVTDDYKLIRQTMHLGAADQKKAIVAAKKAPILSYNQTDFVKDRVAVEVQLGKYSFIAYDLFVKHLAFYIGDAIDVGIEIVPMKSMQGDMSSGPGYYESSLYDLARQGRGSPPVPLVLVGVQP